MKLVESEDGTVKVIELDPTKWYWLVADNNAGIRPEHIKFRNGNIIYKHVGTAITFIENPNRILEGMKENAHGTCAG